MKHENVSQWSMKMLEKSYYIATIQSRLGWYVVIVPCHEIWFKLRDWFLVKWHEVTSTYYVLCCDAWIVAKRVNKFRSIWHWQRFTEDDRAFPSLMVDPRVEYLGTTNNITAQWAEKQTYYQIQLNCSLVERY